MMRKLFFFFAFTVITSALIAQNRSFSWKVTDSVTHQSIEHSRIVIQGIRTDVYYTDTAGNLALVLHRDAKTIIVSKQGYIPQYIKPGNDTLLNIGLVPAHTPASEQLYSPSREEEWLIHAPFQVEKMRTEEITSAASGDFYQSLGNYRGVDVVTSSTFMKSVNLRGFGDTRMLRVKQLIDGVDNESPGFNAPMGNMFGANELDLESVEILSDPASALYGANVMQGVIAMRTKSPYDQRGFSAQITSGATSIPAPYFNGQFRYANAFGKEKRFAFKLTGEYAQTKDWAATDDSLNRYGKTSTGVNLDKNLQQNINAPYCATCPVTEEQHNSYVAQQNFLDSNSAAAKYDPAARNGFVNAHAPGYQEKDLADYNAINAKASAGIYYRFNTGLQLSGTYRFGYGRTVYQGIYRYQLKDFFFHQGVIEASGRNFSVKAYASYEDAGQSYNLGLTGASISRSAIPDYANRFSNAYFNTIDTLLGGFSNCVDCFSGGGNQWILDSARNEARRAADVAWYKTGTQAFSDTFRKAISQTKSPAGTRLTDKSVLIHLDGQYQWDFINWLDIITGASYRLYIPNTMGTMLADTSRQKLRVHEVSSYIQMTKRLWHDNFRITGSIRMDKSSNFKMQLSPRGLLAYTYRGKGSSHTFHVAATTSFRTPTLQEQYFYYDAGPIKLVGNLYGMANLYTLPSVEAYEAYALANPVDTTGAISLLQTTEAKPIQPEQIISYEFGYRADIGNRLFIDLTGYYSIYKNLIGFTKVATPNIDTISGYAGEQSGAANIAAGIYTPYQTWVNMSGSVPSWGASASISCYAGRGITPYVNYTYADVDDKKLKSSGTIVMAGFNTPRHKVNVGINANKVWKGLGFSANWKWVSGYEWISPFANGKVPSYHTLDMQIYYESVKTHSTIRLGASNIYNNRHIEAAGAPKIGAMYYVCLSFDFNIRKK